MFRRILLIVLALALLVGLHAGGMAALRIRQYAHIDETQPADVAIVLGAAAWRNRPSPVFAERINHAIELYLQGYVHNIIFTGGYGRNPQIADSEIARDYALQRGVPASAIYVETNSTDTEENLIEAQKLMQSLGFTSALLVSDPLHMYRIQLLSVEIGLEGFSSPTPTSRYRSSIARVVFTVREVYSLFLHWLEEVQ
ncbi:MAG TPA: YdcF family protein [Anaerolineales bacterium]|nr:YdcF family protein [Anaerolineales bacterium]HRQ92078.1 YdcF family protein [Anaerolineales bacterium]